MKKIIAAITSLVLIIANCNIGIMARTSEIDDVTFYYDNGKLVISGIIDNGEGTPVQVVVPKVSQTVGGELIEKEIDDILAGADFSTPYYIRQKNIDNKDSYSIGIDTNGLSGWNMFRISIPYMNIVRDEKFYIPSTNDENEALRIFKLTEADEIDDFIKDYYWVFSLDIVKYNDAPDKDYIANGLYSAKDEITTRESFVNKYNQLYNEGKAIYELKSSTKSTFANVLKENKNIFECDTENQNGYLYLKQSSDIQKVYDAVTSENTISDIKTAFDETVALCSINSATWDDVSKLITNQEVLKNLCDNRYNQLSGTYKTEIYEDIAKSTFSTLDEFKTKFKSLVELYASKNGEKEDKDGVLKDSIYNMTVVGGVTPVEKPAEDTQNQFQQYVGFADLEGSQWAEEDIYSLVDKGIFNGRSKTVFAPKDNIKREEFAAVVTRAFEFNQTSGKSYNDVPEDSWARDVIDKASTAGIMNGINEGAFGYGQDITRQDLCVVLFRAMQTKNIKASVDEEDIFVDDEQIAEYAREAVYTLRNYGIISGYEDGTFKPKACATRAETAHMLNKSLNEMQYLMENEISYGDNKIDYLYDDFSSYEITDDFSSAKWKSDPKKGYVAIKEDEAEGKYLSFYIDGAVSAASGTHPMSSANLFDKVSHGKLNIDIRLRPNSDKENATIAVKDTASGASALSLVFRATTGQYGINNKYIFGKYTAGEWYDISFKMDFDKKYTDVYLNGELVGNHIEWYFENAVNIDAIEFNAWPVAGVDVGFDVSKIHAYSTIEEKESVTEDNAENDVEDYTDSYQLLKALDIIEDTEPDFTKIVTRAEAASIATRLAGYNQSEMEYYDQLPFNDVDILNEHRRDIAYVNEMGYMTGTDGNFYPDEYITADEMAEVFVKVLGYNFKESNEINYPMLAKEIDLFDKVDVLSSGRITYGNALLMAENMINSNAVSVTANGLILQNEDKTYLENKFKVKKIKGIVTSNHITGLTLPKDSRDNQVEIDGNEYTSELSLQDLLGYNVDGWVDEDGENLIYARERKKANNTIVVSDRDIVSSAEDNGTEFIYSQDGKKEKTIDISDMHIIYNGVALGKTASLAYMCPKYGNVKFLDNDRDGNYEYAFVKDGKSSIVSVANVSEEKIVFRDNTVIEIDEYCLITKEGRIIGISELGANDVADIYSSANDSGKKYTTINISSARVFGKINSVSKGKAKIDNKEYYISKYYPSDIKKLAIGLAGNFYLNTMGEVVYYKENTLVDESWNSGLLVKVSSEDDYTNLYFKIFTSNAEMVSYSGNEESITINKDKYKNMEDAVDVLKLSALDDTGYRQPIKYRLDANGNIKEINTDDFERAVNIVPQTDDPTFVDPSFAARSYRKGSMIFYNHAVAGTTPFIISDNTTIYAIPSIDHSNYEEYEVVPPSVLAEGVAYNVAAFNKSDVSFAPIVVALDINGSDYIDKSGYIMIVDNVEEVYSDYAGTVLTISGYYKGEYVTYEEKEAGKLYNNPKKGDVVYINLDRESRIISSQLLLNVENQSEFIETNSYYSSSHMLFGALKNSDGTVFTVSKNPSTDTQDQPFKINNYSYIYKYDKDKQEVEYGTIDDLALYTYSIDPSSRVLIRASSGVAREVIIIK